MCCSLSPSNAYCVTVHLIVLIPPLMQKTNMSSWCCSLKNLVINICTSWRMFQPSNFHLWTKRSTFSSSKRHPLDKEYFACFWTYEESSHAHQRQVHLCHIIPHMIFTSNRLLQWILTWSFSPLLLRSVLRSYRPTASKQTSRVMTTRRRLRCVRAAVFFWMCLWNECLTCLTSSL